MRAKRVYEFHKTGDVKTSLRIGAISKIKAEMEEEGLIENRDFWITDTGVFYGKPFSNSIYKIMAIFKSFISEKERELISFLRRTGGSSSEGILKGFLENCLDTGTSPQRLKDLVKFWSDKSNDLSLSKIYLAELLREEEDKEREDSENIYVFIGFNDKSPIEINGKKYYEDKLNVEKIVKIDKYNPSDLRIVSMMKTRLVTQNYQDGAVYMLKVPKEIMDEDYYSEIPEHLRDIIEKYKYKI